ncbi:replication protein RepA [Aromatoleum buckelii]|nr:replication protein RepA [Aromatoleum buckelii]MCK0509786.1 replication protein RepA [Aromatoleum buckelii]
MSLFDEDEYARELAAKGLDPVQAAEIARRTAGTCKPGRLPKSAGPADDLFAPSGTVQAAAPARGTAIVSDLIDSAATILTNEPSGSDIAYLHAILCQVGLPRGPKAVEGLTVFERVCGGAALRVTAGALWDGQQLIQQPIPYGANPRLVLAWLNTQAVRSRSPVIPVGDSAAEFLRMLGKESTGGKNGTLTSFKKQIQALAACHMTLGFNAAGRAYTYNGQPVKQFEAWIQPRDSQQRPLWPGVITFSDDYYKSLVDHAVPQDVRAMYALKGSALAMDIYAMLAERLHRISGRPLMLHWKSLREQFGQEYQGAQPDKDFRKKFLPALKKVLAVYPKAKVQQVTGGLLLYPSPPPIQYK